MNDKVFATGELQIILQDQFGNIKIDKLIKNLVVFVGLSFIASRLAGVNSSVMSHMSVGNSSILQKDADTALISEFSGGRVPLDTLGGTVNTNVITYTATFGPGVATGSISEAGIFNSLTGGTMLSRATFFPVPKTSLDTFTVIWNIKIV